MNIVDVVIILVLVLGLVVGAKKGFTRQLVDTVGTIAVIVLSFLLKGYVSSILYKFCPFFHFSVNLEGITSLNLLLYEVVAFFILFIILSSILKILKLTTNIFEKFLKMTIVLGIPSKILGAIVGMIQNFIFLFVALYFLRLPVLGLELIKESKLSDKILNSTPLLSSVCKNTLSVFEDFDKLIEEYKNEKDHALVNQKTLELLVEKKIVNIEVANKLIAEGKLENAVALQRKEA